MQSACANAYAACYFNLCKCTVVFCVLFQCDKKEVTRGDCYQSRHFKYLLIKRS